MDDNYYSDKTIRAFVRQKLCHNDRLLKKYYESGDIQKFRSRLARVGDEKTIEEVVYSVITDACRDIIYGIVALLTKFLKPVGELIITGGEAFNLYFDRDSRVITSDIDTKFVPNFGKKNFFENLQIVKILLWDKLGNSSERFEKKIVERVKKYVTTSKIGKFLGINFSETGPYVTRRYTLIKKTKQSNSNEVVKKDVLIDVELFALDLSLRYFSISKKKIVPQVMGGILDIPFMRPGELGYEVAFNQDKGLLYSIYGTNKVVYNRNLMFAGKRFLVEDLYLMTTLGLRPHKKQKDKKRILRFAKNVLKMRISSDIPNLKVFEKVLKKIEPNVRSRRQITKIPKEFSQMARKVNVNRYTKHTTRPDIRTLKKKILIGLKGTKGMNIPGFKPTKSNYRFDLKDMKWKLDERQSYVRNQYTYRPNSNIKLEGKLSHKDILYGYNPIRNRRMSPTLVKKAAMIPLTGLKNTPVIS